MSHIWNLLIFLKKTFFDFKFGFLILLVIISLLLYIPIAYLNYGIFYDEGGFMFMAKKILEGSLPYKDYFDQKPPGIYYSFALFFLILGKSLFTIRIFVFIFNIGIAYNIYLIGMELNKEFIGKIASLIYVIVIFTPAYIGFIGQVEPFMTFFCLLGIFFVCV